MAVDASGFGLERFLEAQASAYATALREMRSGEKRSHWMWFIFPQIAGLGSSAMAQRYAIRGRDEAIAYLEHPLLGSRLREITQTVNALTDTTVSEIFGYPDDLKFHSSMTLFAAVARPPDSVFAEALTRWFGGTTDEATLQRLR